MAIVRNTMKLIEESTEQINERYDLYSNNINDIHANSGNPIEMIVKGFRFGYMQGVKATRAELRNNWNIATQKWKDKQWRIWRIGQLKN